MQGAGYDVGSNYSPLLLSTRMIYVTTTLIQTWRSLCSTSLPFSKGRITASKVLKTIISRGMCRFSVMQIERLSVLSTPVAGSMTSHTRRAVFLIVFSLQPITEQLHNKRSNSCHEKLSFKSTNNKCKATRKAGVRGCRNTPLPSQSVGPAWESLSTVGLLKQLQGGGAGISISQDIAGCSRRTGHCREASPPPFYA